MWTDFGRMRSECHSKAEMELADRHRPSKNLGGRRGCVNAVRFGSQVSRWIAMARFDRSARAAYSL